MAGSKTRAEFEAAKQQRFRSLVRHASRHAPYYANIIRERGLDLESCGPADFPVLTKTLLMANFDAIVTDPRLSKQVVADFLTRSSDPAERLFDKITVTHTSGTSGEVGYFLYAPADRMRMRAMSMRNRRVFRHLFPRRWPGLRRIRVGFYGATGGHYAGVTGVASMQRGVARLLVNAQAFEVNTPLPSVISGLKILAEEQRAARLRIRPMAIMATGEMVTKADMSFLSAAFGGATASSIYACTEHMMMGVSNPDGETMTLTDENLIFEIFEDHTLITNLCNYTMPLIRYRMSDILRVVSEPDARHIVINNLVGRMEQMPTFVNSAGAKDFISPHTINEVFVQGVTRFQMQITGPTSFRFPICVDATLNAAARSAAAAGVTARLREILQQKGLGNVTFEVPIVAEIPLNQRTRKFQLIVQKRVGEV
jgi:phenylacetate-coenzyme A ligase PaaK-like adenylate-forming protein